MYARFALLFLLASAVQQGFAASEAPSKDIGYSYGVNDVIKMASNVLPRLSIFTNLTRGFEYCKVLLQKVTDGIWNFFRNIPAFKDDAVRAYQEYRECNRAVDNNAATVCRESVRLEYLNSVQERTRFVYLSLKQTFINTLKIPVCMFAKGRFAA